MNSETLASKFLARLQPIDSTRVYEVLQRLQSKGVVEQNQDWKNGISTYTFSDGSKVVMEGGDVITEASA